MSDSADTPPFVLTDRQGTRWRVVDAVWVGPQGAGSPSRRVPPGSDPRAHSRYFIRAGDRTRVGIALSPRTVAQLAPQDVEDQLGHALTSGPAYPWRGWPHEVLARLTAWRADPSYALGHHDPHAGAVAGCPACLRVAPLVGERPMRGT